jgi:hypothetical protein
MHIFPVRHGRHTRQAALTSLYPASRQSDSEAYSVSCGIYEPRPHDPHEMKWTGLSLDGQVPVPEFIRWALRKGYLKWKTSIV